MMLEHLEMKAAAADVQRAVLRAVAENKLTADVGGDLSIREVGDFIAGAL